MDIACYSTVFKLKVIKLAEEMGIHYASKEVNVDCKYNREWGQNREKSAEFC